MLRCRQITAMVASDEFVEAGSWLRFKIRLHLMMCRHCARYEKQMQALGAGARDRFCAEKTDVKDLQRRILEAAGKSKEDRS